MSRNHSFSKVRKIFPKNQHFLPPDTHIKTFQWCLSLVNNLLLCYCEHYENFDSRKNKQTKQRKNPKMNKLKIKTEKKIKYGKKKEEKQ